MTLSQFTRRGYKLLAASSNSVRINSYIVQKKGSSKKLYGRWDSKLSKYVEESI